MMKAGARLEDGRLLLVFGLSDGNCAKLLADQPIMFDGADVACPEWFFCISCRQSCGRIAVPKDPPKPLILIPLPASCLGPNDGKLRLLGESNDEPAAKIVIFRGRDEQAMLAAVRQFISAETDFRVSGFPPGSFPVSQN